jgi:hypothetical protein
LARRLGKKQGLPPDNNSSSQHLEIDASHAAGKRAQASCLSSYVSETILTSWRLQYSTPLEVRRLGLLLLLAAAAAKVSSFVFGQVQQCLRGQKMIEKYFRSSEQAIVPCRNNIHL